MAIFFVRERYTHGEGVLYRLDPRVKTLVVVAFAFAVTLIPEGYWLAFAAFGAFVALAIALSRLPLPLVFGRSALALPFVLVTVPLIFTREGDTLFTLPLLGWTGSSEGLTATGSIMVKSWMAVLMAVVLTGVTQPVDLIRGLERLRMPRILAGTTFFMYRYLFVIGEEGHRLMRARDARSAAPAADERSGGTVAWRARVLGSMVGSLFIRSYERAERVYLAMQARGYDGAIRFADDRAMANRDWMFLAAGVACIVGLTAYARL